MIAFKLVRKRKDGTYGPLFINARQRIPVGEWLKAGTHPTKGYACRPGWHVLPYPEAPHLRTGGDRVWLAVEVRDYTAHERPDAQGGLWYTAKHMRVIGELVNHE